MSRTTVLSPVPVEMLSFPAPAVIVSSPAPPLIVSLGPHATLVDHRYNETYFGVTAIQSVRSGLPRFNAEGGLLTYGVGGSVVLPLTQHLTANLVTGFDRLADDAARSPLVSLRGSKNQFSGGVFISYKF